MGSGQLHLPGVPPAWGSSYLGVLPTEAPAGWGSSYLGVWGSTWLGLHLLLKYPQGLPWVMATVPPAGDLSKTQFQPSPALTSSETACHFQDNSYSPQIVFWAFPDPPRCSSRTLAIWAGLAARAPASVHIPAAWDATPPVSA